MNAPDMHALTLESEAIRTKLRDHVVSEARRAGLNTTTTLLPDEGLAGFGMWLCRGARKCVVVQWNKHHIEARIMSEGQLRYFEHTTAPTVYEAVSALISTGKVPRAMLIQETP